MTALEWPGKTLTVEADVPIGKRSRIVLLGSTGRALHSSPDLGTLQDDRSRREQERVGVRG